MVSKDTTVIIAVFSVVGAIVLLAAVYKFVKWRRSGPPAPLPPAQPLSHAHYRGPYKPDYEYEDLPNISIIEAGALEPAVDTPKSLRGSWNNSPRTSRPLSQASSYSNLSTSASRSTLRGTPHGPHSQVQIVLPAPLAPSSTQSSDVM